MVVPNVKVKDVSYVGDLLYYLTDAGELYSLSPSGQKILVASIESRPDSFEVIIKGRASTCQLQNITNLSRLRC